MVNSQVERSMYATKAAQIRECLKLLGFFTDREGPVKDALDWTK